MVKRELLGCASFSTATHHIIGLRAATPHTAVIRHDSQQIRRGAPSTTKGRSERLLHAGNTEPKSEFCVGPEAEFQGFP
jgi:hypothetical protein